MGRRTFERVSWLADNERGTGETGALCVRGGAACACVCVRCVCVRVDGCYESNPRLVAGSVPGWTARLQPPGQCKVFHPSGGARRVAAVLWSMWPSPAATWRRPGGSTPCSACTHQPAPAFHPHRAAAIAGTRPKRPLAAACCCIGCRQRLEATRLRDADQRTLFPAAVDSSSEGMPKLHRVASELRGMAAGPRWPGCSASRGMRRHVRLNVRTAMFVPT